MPKLDIPSGCAALEPIVAAAFKDFAVRDINLPSWWGQADTERFVSKLAARLAKRAPAMAARIAELEAALRFYANPAVYEPHPHGPAFDRRDLSATARAALAAGGAE